MLGIDPKSLTGELVRVPPEHDEKPAATIENPEARLGLYKRYMDRWYGPFDFATQYHRLPLKALRRFNFDELYKLRYSSSTMMDASVEDHLKKDPNYCVLEKICSSLWRWSSSRGTWGEIVDAYNNIRAFKLDIPGFEVRLDHTTSYNEFGRGQYSHRTYLDGAFGFLVHYKGEHMLTIGFSILSERRLLLHQVQSAKRSGNRGLFKLPCNRVEFVLDRFAKCFPGYRLFVVDGVSLAKKTVASYGVGLESEEKVRDHYWQSWRSATNPIEADQQCRRFRRAEKRVMQYHRCIRRVRHETSRLSEFYRQVGRYQLGEPITKFSLVHYEVLVPSAQAQAA
jgi:hypothetical protein